MADTNNTITLDDLQLQSGCTISPFVWRTKYALKHKAFDIDVVPGSFTGIKASQTPMSRRGLTGENLLSLHT